MQMYLLPLAYIISLATAAAITPAVIRFSRYFNLLDIPGPRKVHKKPVPRTGGVAVAASLCISIILFAYISKLVGASFTLNDMYLVAVLAASMLVGLVNLIDDVRSLRARTRFIIELLAAAALCLIGIRINAIAIPGWKTLPLGLFAWPLTLVWITGVTNAVNLIDGLDGLAAGIAATAIGFLALFAFVTGLYPEAVVLTLFGGSLAGFMIYNFNPAKIFLGDCGSTLTGFFIGASSVLLAVQTNNLVPVGIAALALGVPIFDTLFSMLRRFVERRSIFSPDRCHLHHRLLDLGMKHRNVVISIYVITTFAAGFGTLMILTSGLLTILVFAAVCMFLVVIFHAAGAIRIRESIQNLRRNLLIAQEAKEQQKAFEHAQLQFRDATDFDGWWQAACAAAESMGFSRLRLELTRNDGSRGMMQWTNGHDVDKQKVVRTIVPVNIFGHDGPSIVAHFDVPVLTSLESAGLRMKLFSRLIDEHMTKDALLFELPHDFEQNAKVCMQDTQIEN